MTVPLFVSRRPRFGGLWRHTDFLKLWGGQTVSLFGTLATPYTLAAILIFHASAPQIAVLMAARYAPGLITGLFAGILIDRVRRRPLMITADIGRALLLATLPLSAFFGRLSWIHLLIVTLLVSILTVVFEIAYQSYVPVLVPTGYLAEGNAKVSASAAVAEAAGFGLSGVFVQVFTAPGALLVDALSFVVSAVTLGLIREAEPAPERSDHTEAKPDNAWREIADGLRFLWTTPTLRSLALTEATLQLFGNVIGVVIILDWTERLGLSPLVIGIVSGVGGVSAFAGAAVAERSLRQWGVGHVMLFTVVVARLTTFCIVLAGGPVWLAVALLLMQQLCGDAPYAVYEVAALTMRQSLTPTRLLGRINASFQFVKGGTTLMGIALGGVLGSAFGTRGALLVAAIGGSFAALWLVHAPLNASTMLAESETFPNP